MVWLRDCCTHVLVELSILLDSHTGDIANESAQDIVCSMYTVHNTCIMCTHIIIKYSHTYTLCIYVVYIMD